MGRWLDINGEAIYDTHAWTRFEETGKVHIYFTAKGQDLYAIVMDAVPGSEVSVGSLFRGGAAGTVSSVTLLGVGGVRFNQDGAALTVKLPDGHRSKEPQGPLVLKITGLEINPTTNTSSGNPICECRGTP